MYDRQKGKIYPEKQYKESSLNFLYNTVSGRVILKIFITSKLFSRINADFKNSKRSVKQIKKFIDTYQINMDDYEKKDYTSFNDFFTRRLAKGRIECPLQSQVLISPASAKLRVFNIDSTCCFRIKNSVYTISELIGDSKLAKEYEKGICMVFRLTVDDYHRYCYIDKGHGISEKTITGKLHTVSPISAKSYKVYCENQREISVLSTENFGKVIQIEVGALLVGKIFNYGKSDFIRGEEKGYFSFGGSTVILLFKENTVKIDADIMEYSQNDIETKVNIMEIIGGECI